MSCLNVRDLSIFSLRQLMRAVLQRLTFCSEQFCRNASNDGLPSDLTEHVKPSPNIFVSFESDFAVIKLRLQLCNKHHC